MRDGRKGLKLIGKQSVWVALKHGWAMYVTRMENNSGVGRVDAVGRKAVHHVGYGEQN